jgi:methylated-DNA-[protein]-cysteine S-methyltransferase
MEHVRHYDSPLGGILLAADDEGLTGLWFEGQKYFAEGLGAVTDEADTEVLRSAVKWLDEYFSGREPSFTPPLHMTGTDFQKEVWNILLQIPYGETVTYGEIASRIASERGVASMSSQAAGNAVGRNRISIIVPCHRVVGKNGSLTGYAGGIERKEALLRLEKADMTGLFSPTRGTAL